MNDATEVPEAKKCILILFNISDGLVGRNKNKIAKFALDMMKNISSNETKAEILQHITPKLPTSLLNEGLMVVKGFQDDYTRNKLIINILYIMEAEERNAYIKGILDNIKAIDAEDQKANLQILISPLLNGLYKEEVLANALKNTRKINKYPQRAELLAKIAHQILNSEAKEISREAIEIANRIDDKYQQIMALIKVFHELEGSNKIELSKEILRKIKSLRYYDTSDLIIEIYDELPSDLQYEALEEIIRLSKILEGTSLSKAFEWLIKLDYNIISEDLKYKVVNKMLRDAISIPDMDERIIILNKVTRSLPISLLEIALQLTMETQNVLHQAEIFSFLTLRFTEKLQKKSLEASRKLICETGNANINLRDRPKPLPETVLKEFIQSAQKIEGESRKAIALMTISSRLSTSQRPKVLRDALDSARKTEDERLLVDVLSKIAISSPEILGCMRKRTLKNIIVGIKDEHNRNAALANIATALSEEILEWAIEMILIGQDEDNKVMSLSRIASRVPHLALNKAIKTSIDENKLSKNSVNIIDDINKKMSKPMLKEALEAARTISDDYVRNSAFALLVPFLKILHQEFVYNLWNETLHVMSTHSRKDLLSDLKIFVPVVCVIGGITAASDTCQAIEDVCQWWP